MKCIFRTFLLLLISLSTEAQVFTVETVPNTKLVNNSYVSDPTQILNDTTVARINQLLDSLEAKTTAQVAVVLLPSIGDADRFEFAQRLFEYWKIGQAEKDNGLLILFILDQRTIRFHTGFGLEGLLSDARCKQIQEHFMVPSFREGDYNAGLLLGIEKVAAILTTPEAIDEIFVEEERIEEKYLLIGLSIAYGLYVLIAFSVAWINDKFKKPSDVPRIIISRSRWLFLYGLLPLVLCYASFQFEMSFGVFFSIAYMLVVFLFLERYRRIYNVLSEPFVKKKNYQALHNFYQDHNGYWLTAAIFFFIPMFFVYRWYKKKVNSFRNGPRPCKKCGTLIQKMSEKTEDEFLNSGQIAEEKIGTIDYDVWKCNTCGLAEILAYPGKTTYYSRCPQCNFQTYHFGSRRTLEAATYTSEGRGQEVRTCKHCGHHHTDTFVIAMLVAATSSSDNDSSSSFSDSSSSSSDSGGSWGGGDSGGGGADSSW